MYNKNIQYFSAQEENTENAMETLDKLRNFYINTRMRDEGISKIVADVNRAIDNMDEDKE